eukprot:4493475-Pyramimonas_sp.AAC.1
MDITVTLLRSGILRGLKPPVHIPSRPPPPYSRRTVSVLGGRGWEGEGHEQQHSDVMRDAFDRLR